MDHRTRTQSVPFNLPKSNHLGGFFPLEFQGCCINAHIRSMFKFQLSPCDSYFPFLSFNSVSRLPHYTRLSWQTKQVSTTRKWNGESLNLHFKKIKLKLIEFFLLGIRLS